jgi:hypothetical protein
MARQESANQIINDAALEIGLEQVADPWSSTDDAFVQLRGLLNAAGRELAKVHDWQILFQDFNILTSSSDSGTYDLPEDFDRMIDQTGWDRSNRVAVGGPLGAQDWAYLEGRDLISQSIYASFRLADNKIDLYPQPPPDGLTISFIYISRNWVKDTSVPAVFKDRAGTGSDVCLLDPLLVTKFLKVKYLSAKGFDTSAAALDFDNIWNTVTGRDEGASILSASNNSRGFPYLHPYYNTADTGYGI